MPTRNRKPARLCAGGITLRNQINQKWPHRDRRTDGWIGDRKHSERISDHNPDENGIVHAIDIDENFGRGKERNGAAAMRLADELLAYAQSALPGAKRLKYVVYEDQIASGTYKRTWWRWRGRGYGHTAHIHVSFTNAADSDGSLWPLPSLARDEIVRVEWAKALGID
jgi:hypothetical protein